MIRIRSVASFVGLLVCVLVVTGHAQDKRSVANSDYLISAKAGGVNYVEGKVSVFRRSGTSGYLITGDEVNIGDRVTTAADGRAEVLLNPGSYLRIGGNTSFDFISTDLEDLKINLRTGSSIFEVYASNEFKVSVKTPQSGLVLTRSGVYRIDVLADGSARLSVFKGRAFVGPNEATEVESGRMATVAPGGVSISKFDRDTNDSLDIWSKSRGKDLAKANARLQRNSMRNTLLSSFDRRGWNMYNSFGLWVFDPMRRMWLFLPFGYGWSSPYGFGYDFSIWSCRLPWYIYNQPWYPPTTGGGTPTNPGPGRTDKPARASGPRPTAPPFIIMQGGNGRGSEVGNSDTGSSGGSRRSRDGDSVNAPTYNPPVFVPPSPPPVMPRVETQRGGETKGKP